MDFAYSPRVEELRCRVREFMEDHVLAAVPLHESELAAGHAHPPCLEDLKALARAEGLWNLFLPGLRDDEPGTRLTNLEYAPLAEIMGRIAGPPRCSTAARRTPATWRLLHLFATAAQREQWLLPLLEGAIRSCFAMTEPDVASSDATNIQTRIRREGDAWIVNGRKWFISDAAHPHCRVAIVMGMTDPDADPHRRQSMVLVPLDTPGVDVVRNMPVMHHFSPEGHCEILFRRRARTGRQPDSARRAPASRSRRRGSARVASTTACARSARRSSRSS